MRHAQSGHPGGVRDHDRPLTEAGWAAAGLAGDWLRSTLGPIDEVMCSTALRAQQTAHATGTAVAIRSEADVYDATPGDILGLLRTTGAVVRTLLVVGHAPGIPALAVQLIAVEPDPDEGGERVTGDQGAADQLRARFPTAALAVLQFEGEWAELDDGAARLTFFRIPPG